MMACLRLLVVMGHKTHTFLPIDMQDVERGQFLMRPKLFAFFNRPYLLVWSCLRFFGWNHVNTPAVSPILHMGRWHQIPDWKLNQCLVFNIDISRDLLTGEGRIVLSFNNQWLNETPIFTFYFTHGQFNLARPAGKTDTIKLLWYTGFLN